MTGSLALVSALIVAGCGTASSLTDGPSATATSAEPTRTTVTPSPTRTTATPSRASSPSASSPAAEYEVDAVTMYLIALRQAGKAAEESKAYDEAVLEAAGYAACGASHGRR